MTAAEMIRAIEEIQRRYPDQRGDQLPPCDGPDPDWPSAWTADHRALADEDRLWRLLP